MRGDMKQQSHPKVALRMAFDISVEGCHIVSAKSLDTVSSKILPVSNRRKRRGDSTASVWDNPNRGKALRADNGGEDSAGKRKTVGLMRPTA